VLTGPSNISNIPSYEDNNQNDLEDLEKEINLVGENSGKIDKQTATKLEQIDNNFEKM
jgi:hypothetical protein